jgi:hypothetical protein
MRRRLPFAGLFLSAIILAACGDDPTPAAPTPPATTPPPTAAPPPAPPAEPAALASLAVEPTSAASQSTPEGTVTLTAAAPTGGAVIMLESGSVNVARVPSSITIAAGSTTGTFRIETTTVAASSVVTIAATYAGITRSTQFTVLPPVLEPRFTVSSVARGPDICAITTSAGATDCEFNASSSSGFVARYLWTLRLRDTEFSFTAQDNQASINPMTTCGFLGNGTAQEGRVTVEVSLQLEDRSGARSSTLRRTFTLIHTGQCGY